MIAHLTTAGQEILFPCLTAETEKYENVNNIIVTLAVAKYGWSWVAVGYKKSSLRYIETHCVSSICPGPYQILTVMLSLAVLRKE